MKTAIMNVFIIVFSISLIVGFFAWAQDKKAENKADSHSGHIVISPDTLTWVDVSSLPPGAKIAVLEGDPKKAGPFTMRVKFPAKYRVPAHWHPADEHVTVISGTLNIGLGDRFDRAKVRAIPAGAFTVMPAHTNHFAWIEEETILQLHGTGPWELNYVNPVDDPRKNLN
jgi:quercetin dioxygenase-like cupin family protein